MYEVLIVEDDPMVAMIDKQYVHQNNHFHISGVCKDGTSALEYLLSNTVHLVILDVYMPKTDGLELLRKIRESNLPVSVIMVTAANDGATIEEALRLGIIDYLVKPFTNTRFQLALNKFIGIQNAFHDLPTLDQNHIDLLIQGTKKTSEENLPKGIQEHTLNVLMEFMEIHSNAEWTGDEIADKTGLSKVTVRRYMNYMIEKSWITGRMNYETGGRPSMLYQKKEEG